MYLAFATIARGWALSEQGRQEEGIEEIRKGHANLQATGTRLMRPHFLALLAEALVKSGQAEEALRVLEEAIAIAQSNGEKYYEAELYRIKGEALLAQASSRCTSLAATGGESVFESEQPVVAQAEGCFN